MASLSRLAARPPEPVEGRRRQQDAHLLGGEDLQDCPDDRGLAHPQAAGDHQQLRYEGAGYRLALAPGQRQADALLDPGESLFGINRRPRQRRGGKPAQPLGNAALGMIWASEEHALPLADTVADHCASRQFEIEGRADQVIGDPEQAFGERQQFRH